MTKSADGREPSDQQTGVYSRKDDRAYRRRRRALARLGLVVLLLASATAIAGAFLAHQISLVRTNLTDTLTQVPMLRNELSEGDFAGANATSARIQSLTAKARSTSSGPLWKAASAFPLFGPNLRAVTDVSVSADDVAAHAVAPLISSSEFVNLPLLSATDGPFVIKSIQQLAPSLSTAATTARLSHDRLASIDLDPLLPEVANPLRSATEQLEALSRVLDTASSTAKLLPPMLGVGGERNYLVLVQNSAEARATGGIPGALAVLATDNGNMKLGEQTSAAAMDMFKPSIVVEREQEKLFTARLGTQMQNVNLTPDFPTAAKTAKEMWEQRHPNQTVDGVIALDTVVLSHLLEATGPLDLADEQVLDIVRGTNLPLSLTKDNVVPTLLSKVYQEIEDPETQDVYFAAVAGRVFTAFTEGQGDGLQLMRAVGASTDENRLFLWSSHPDEQAILASSPLNGSVTGADGGGKSFGVYFNDGTGAKMDYYVTRSVQLIQACPVGDYGRYTARVTVTNNAPADAASSLPKYVTGGGVFGVEPGRVRTNYVMYGPAQSFVESARVNGETVAVGSGKHGQRPVGTITQELAPGETAIIEVDFTQVVQDSEPRLHVTPTIQPLTDVVLPSIREESCQ